MTQARDRVVALVGGLALVLVLVGFVVVEARTGPFEHAATRPDGEASITGEVIRQAQQAPQGATDACTADPTGQVCQPARTAVELTVEGLPPLSEPARYAAFLTGEDRVLELGALTLEGGQHRLSFDEQEDPSGLDALVITLVREERGGAPSPFVVHRAALPVSQEQVTLDEEARLGLDGIEGTVTVAQIGAVEVSATAEIQVQGLPSVPGWSYRAWFIEAGNGQATLLGTLDHEDGAARLDARVPQVDLDAQERVLITLEPAGNEPGKAPSGYPVVDVGLQVSGP